MGARRVRNDDTLMVDGQDIYLSETAWVTRAQEGDVTAVSHLARSYQQELLRLSFRLLGDRGDAEDVVQEVLVTMWRQLPQLSDPQAFRSWIYTITTRRCLNVVRQRARRRTDAMAPYDLEVARGPESHLVTTVASPEQATETRAVRSSLEESMLKLPTDQRICWVLNQLHDLTYPHIADIIGEPVSTVRGRIARARQGLAKEMAAWL